MFDEEIEELKHKLTVHNRVMRWIDSVLNGLAVDKVCEYTVDSDQHYEDEIIFNRTFSAMVEWYNEEFMDDKDMRGKILHKSYSDRIKPRLQALITKYQEEKANGQ